MSAARLPISDLLWINTDKPDDFKKTSTRSAIKSHASRTALKINGRQGVHGLAGKQKRLARDEAEASATAHSETPARGIFRRGTADHIAQVNEGLMCWWTL